MLSHRIPNADFTGRRKRDKLCADEKEGIDGNVQVECSNVNAVAGFGEEHGPNLLSERNGDHGCGGLTVRPAAGRQAHGAHLGIDGDPLDGGFKVWTEKYYM